MTRNGCPRARDLAYPAAVIALAIAMLALAALLYALVDLLVAFFLGIVVAAALQPWHAKLVHFGVPRGLAVLLIYLLILTVLLIVGILVEPVLVEQISSFLSTLPAQYTAFRDALRGSATPLFHMIGRRLPAFEALPSAAAISPALYEGIFGFTTSLLGFLGYFVTVLAVGFYWTMEVPRVERLLLSLTPVNRRQQVLDIWHEIEAKLGAFIRGQAILMLAVGVMSGIGYAIIGLPNAFALAVLAGLLEAVPLIGPTLAAVPAVLAALPLGFTSILAVLGWTVFVQLAENNVLVPRIMSQTVGISALMGIFGVLAFGILYGVVGVFVAIPVMASIQVLFDRLLLRDDVREEAAGAATSPLERLRTRAHSLRQQARMRLRGRDTRPGGATRTVDYVVDAVDQEIERAVERVETIIIAAERKAAANPDAHELIVGELHGATEHIEQAGQHVENAVAEATTPQNGANTAAASDEQAQPDSVARQAASVEVLTTQLGLPKPEADERPNASGAEGESAAQAAAEGIEEVEKLLAAAPETSAAQLAAVERLKQAEEAVERAEAKMAELENSRRNNRK
ncbi:MAG: AI-2E family transporter [Candidatus Binatia bacterium]